MPDHPHPHPHKLLLGSCVSVWMDAQSCPISTRLLRFFALTNDHASKCAGEITGARWCRQCNVGSAIPIDMYAHVVVMVIMMANIFSFHDTLQTFFLLQPFFPLIVSVFFSYFFIFSAIFRFFISASHFFFHPLHL